MRPPSFTGWYGAFWIGLGILLVAGFFVLPADSWATKSIKVEFEPGWAPAGLDEGNLQDQVVARMKSHFGFGGGTVNVFTNNATTSFHKKVIFKAARNGWTVGRHFVCKSTNYVYGGTFKTAFANTPALLNSTAAARVYARTGAHEAAHHWGQDDQDGDPTNVMGRPGLGARVNTPAGFTTAAKTEMLTYIRTPDRNKADATLNADMKDDENIVAVFGQYPTGPGVIYDSANSFNAVVTITGDPFGFYEFGWINKYGEFVTKIAAGIPSEVVTMFCEYEMDLAFRNMESLEVFPASEFADPPEYWNAIPFPESSCPVVDEDYYATVNVNFPPLGLSVVMDALPLSPTSGFMRRGQPPPMPGVREWGVVILAMLLAGYAAWKLSRRLRLMRAKK